MYIVDLASGMRHAGRFGYPPTFIEGIITRVRIGLQDTAVVRQMSLRVDTFAVGRVGEPHRCRHGRARVAIVTNIDPQPPGTGLP